MCEQPSKRDDRRRSALTIGPGDRESPIHIACSIRSGRDRELLIEWLATIESVTASTATAETLTRTPFDICIIDRPTLRDVGDDLLARTRAERPRYLPCLLVIPRRAAEETPGDSVPADLQPVVTDVVEVPTKKAALRRRIETLIQIRRLSKRLSRSNRQYRRLVELLPEGIVVLDSGRVRYANPAAETLFGASESSLAGTEFRDLVADEGRATAAEIIETAIETGESEFVDLPVRNGENVVATECAAACIECEHANGDEAGGRLVQLVLRDMTDRNDREDTLRLYRRAMDNANVGITITDATQPDNPLIYVNRAFERLTGRSRSEMLGQNPRIVQSPRTDPETVAAIRRAVDAGKPISVELLNQRADGTEWYNALDITPSYRDGGLTHFLGFQRDITATRARENQLAVLDRVLRHNLRNRLNVVIGHAEELAAGASQEAIPTHATAILQAAEALLALSDEAREFRTALQTDEQVTRPIDLVDILETITDDFADDAAVKIDLDLPATAFVTAEQSVQFIVTELLRNAINHSDRENPHVTVGLDKRDRQLVLRIADDGPGIPESERKAFGDGSETPTDHATGLGLWLVRWAVDSVGGEITYRPNEPRGSAVTVRLPAASMPDPETGDPLRNGLDGGVGGSRTDDLGGSRTNDPGETDPDGGGDEGNETDPDGGDDEGDESDSDGGGNGDDDETDAST